MDENFDLNAVLLRLESEEASEQAAALDELFAMMNTLGRKVVDVWIHSNNRLIIWEKLYLLGVFVIQPLKELLAQTEDTELRIMASTVLLRLGDKTGVPLLLEAISSGDDLCLAARFLSRAHVVEAGDRMIERLRILDIVQTDYITCLLSALEKLGRDLPLDLLERFQLPDAAPEISLFLKEHQ